MMSTDQVNPQAPARLRLDGDALVANWRSLAAQSDGIDCGAAVKADGYGLGARDVVKRLAEAGCRELFVAHWSEAKEISDIVPPEQISVLNGCTDQEFEIAQAIGAIPVLNTPAQIASWKANGGGRCHIMFDSGINRLGIGPEQLTDDLLGGLDIDIFMSHLASADEDRAQNTDQLQCFKEVSHDVVCKRRSLSNSAGIMLGQEYHFDLLRPGLSLYGGIARPEMADFISPVVKIEARVIQLREMSKGNPVGYNGTYQCPADMVIATIALGYADGYLRAFSNKGSAKFLGNALPVVGRVSMDMVTLDARSSSELKEGDWVKIEYRLPESSAISGLSQYELLTGLGSRFDRIWD